MIEDNFFTIFIDSILLDRAYFAVRIVIKKPIDSIFVYIELLSPGFEQVENEHHCNEMFIRSTTSMRYSL